jgi:hypothetical protein
MAVKKHDAAHEAASTELANVSEKSNLPQTYDDVFSDHAGQGLENVKASDVTIPRITILQALSPQINAKKPEFIKGAKVGDICDVGTGDLFESPLVFLPVHYTKQWLEWAPRASGKGLIAIHADNLILDECKQDEKGRYKTKDGNLISETAQFFGLNLMAGNRRSFLPLSSTQLKKAKKWLTLSTSERIVRPNGTSFVPPIYYRSYELSTVEESNAEGDWVGWKIERGARLQDIDFNGMQWQEVLRDALEFREKLVEGQIKGQVVEAEAESEM